MANGTRVIFHDDLELQERFLEKIVQFGGCIIKAAASVNVAAQTVKNLRNSNQEFKERLADAIETGRMVFEAEAHRRAFQGVKRPVLHNGQQVVIKNPETGEDEPLYEWSFSDTMMIFMLKAMFPEKYRERYGLEHSGPNGGPINTGAKVVIYIPDNGRGPDAPETAEKPAAGDAEVKR